MSKIEQKYQPLNPVLRVILAGVYDNGSPLSSLAGCTHIMKQIWKNVVECYKKHITYGRSYVVTQFHQYPKPNDININMMPFRMSRSFSESFLPKNVKPYWKFIERIRDDQDDLADTICFLTIHESYVEKNESQRRPGMHTETPGHIKFSLAEDIADLKLGTGMSTQTPYHEQIGWGEGMECVAHRRKGGIYMASSVDNSCEVWDCKILRDEETGTEIIGKHGDIEHLREYLPASAFLTSKNSIYWITDRTPHESLPMQEGTYRQFFRLVTGNVSFWYKDHSTENPNGLLPDPKITKIIGGSKFEGNLEIVEQTPDVQHSSTKPKSAVQNLIAKFNGSLETVDHQTPKSSDSTNDDKVEKFFSRRDGKEAFMYSEVDVYPEISDREEELYELM